MASNFINISVEEKEFAARLRELERMHDSLTPKWMKSTQRRKLKPMMNAMKSNSKSDRIASMIAVTTAKKRSGTFGAKVGVVKNDEEMFPTFSAPALAAVLEYGTDERHRTTRRAGIITGKVSTGRVKPGPFLRPAWDAHVQRFMKETSDAITKKVLKEAAK
jgi:hypothetical protein